MQKRSIALLTLCGAVLPLVVANALHAPSDVTAGQVAPLQATSAIVDIPESIDRLDPAANAIIPAHPRLQRIATGFKWTEGPLWLPSNQLLFAEIPSNSIRLWNPASSTVEIFLQPSGYQGTDPYNGPEPGSNAMTLDPSGRLTVAGHAQRDVWRLEAHDPNHIDSHAPITILADKYQGKQLNSPNDVVYKSDGSLYFTDPPYGLRTQQDSDPEKQLSVNGVFRIPNALEHKPGAPPDRDALQLLVSDLTRPNGIAFSPDEKYLYVNNSQPKKIWMRYRVKPDGTLTDAKLLFDDTADTRAGNPDGMKVDVEGNIYSAGPGGIWIFSPEGKPLGTIVLPGRTSNVAWAGPERKTLYITDSEGIYRIHLKIAGEPIVTGK